VCELVGQTPRDNPSTPFAFTPTPSHVHPTAHRSLVERRQHAGSKSSLSSAHQRKASARMSVSFMNTSLGTPDSDDCECACPHHPHPRAHKTIARTRTPTLECAHPSITERSPMVLMIILLLACVFVTATVTTNSRSASHTPRPIPTPTQSPNPTHRISLVVDVGGSHERRRSGCVCGPQAL
jgi:hypothetical protein